MKFILAAAATLALIALMAQAQTFSDELRTYNEQFNEYHREIDYFLRLRRMNSSDMIEQQNRVALTAVWDSVLRLKQLTEEANDKLIYVAIEVGNQDPCIVALFNELQEVEIRAGNEISQCAATMHRQQETAMASGMFQSIDFAQRSSHFLQITTLFTLGQHNTVTEQAAIRSDLDFMWDHRVEIRSEDKIIAEHDHIQLSLQTARLNLINCLAVIEGVYAQDADRIYNAAGACRERK